MLAVLYDIHGNLPALDAVLADAGAAGADRFLLGGDYALFGPWPRETVDRLDALEGATWIRGNGERWTNAPAESPADLMIRRAARCCAEELGITDVARLAALPFDAVIDGVRFCHASPVSDVAGLMPEPTEGEPQLIAEVRERRLVVGHTHRPFQRVAEGELELVNPGSVGMPLDGDPRAAYALINGDGTVELRRVEYEHAASAAAVREKLGDWAEALARRIETAQF